MPSDIKSIFSVNLAHLMEQSADMQSANALAKRSGVAQTTISNYLKPDSYIGFPNLKHVTLIAKAFGKTPWQLLHPQLGSNLVSDQEMELLRRMRSTFNKPS